MISKPKFKSHFHIEKIDGEGIVVISEKDQNWLSGETMIHLTDLMDGKSTVDEIIDKMEGKSSLPEIYYMLSLLERDGLITEAENSLPESTIAFWHSLGFNAKDALAKLAKVSISLQGLNGMDTTTFKDALLQGGAKVVDSDGDLEIVVANDYGWDQLEEINKEKIASGKPWLLVKPAGNTVWLGPLFRPGENACWECLIQRIRSNRQMETYVRNKKKSDRPLITSLSSLPLTLSITANALALELLKYLVLGVNDNIDGNLLTIDLLTMETAKHRVIRRPQCFSCGDEAYYNPSRQPTPVVLEPAPKAFIEDGGHRIMTPEETYERLKHHISPITGVVNSLKRLERDQDSDFIYTYSAGHNFAIMPSRGLDYVIKNIRGRSGGKGASKQQAMVSGMCEAIERYSGVYRGDEVCIQATFEELGEKAIHPNSVMGFSEYQYKIRDEWNKRQRSDNHLVPNRFNTEANISWSPVWSLTNGGFKYIPSSFCYFGHPDLSKSFDTFCDANGNGAGNSLEEAILQAFFELIERDAVAIWWYNRVKVAEVDLDSFNEPYVDKFRAFYAEHNRDIRVLDLTNDLGIPVFAAISARTDRDVEDIVLGFGAHLDPRIALFRALTEVNQFMPCVFIDNEQGKTDYWFHDPDAIYWWMNATLRSEPYLVAREDIPKRKHSEYPKLWTDDCKTDVEKVVDIMSSKGFETFVLDQSRPDIDLNVAKVIVPGLRHFWRRLGPGRLYDVPVQLGWLDKPTAEADFNPMGVFF